MAKKKQPEEDESGGDAEMMDLGSAQNSDQAGTKPISASNRIVICKWSGCYDMATVGGHCRLHYLSNWKKLKTKEAKKEGKELADYLSEMSARFPEEFFEKLRNELEEMSNDSKDDSDNSKEDRSSFFDNDDSDDDMDTIIKGIRIEDY